MNWDQFLREKRFRDSTSKPNEHDGRTAFDNDYSRVVNSSAVRRLQDKAQVFPLKKGDFVRSRLTHSLEVSHFGHSIGLSIQKELVSSHKISDNDCGKISGILATAGLVHDLGNPPFGHFGETAIKDYLESFFKDCGYDFKEEKIIFDLENKQINIVKDNFVQNIKSHILTKEEINDLVAYDGNAQTLRILSKLHYFFDKYSYNLTLPTLATIIKYPKPSYSIEEKKINKKFGYFLSEKEIYNQIQTDLNLQNKRHPLTFLLEACDDIAYSIADLEDGVKKKIIDSNSILNKFKSYEKKIKFSDIVERDIKKINEVVDKINFKEEGHFKGSKKLKEIIKIDEYDEETRQWFKLKESILLLKYYKDSNGYENIDDVKLQSFRVHVQNEMIKSTVKKFIEESERIENLEYRNDKKEINVLEESEAKHIRLATKEIAADIFKSKEIVEAEILGYKVIQYILKELLNASLSEKRHDDRTIEGKIYNIISYNYKFINALSPYKKEYIEEFNDSKKINEIKNLHVYDRIRIVIDFVSGMTDTYALSLYKKMTN